ncbi:MAG: hypothetical protein WDO15_22085 [Bacteroidota bacterium]
MLRHPSTEELLMSHDQYFNENLTASADPAVYDFGVVLLTKFSSLGDRIYSKLEGHSPYKRLVNMRVSDDNVYLIGRIKTGQQPNSWDAWVYVADASSGNQLYEKFDRHTGW